MADKTISELPVASGIGTNDISVVVSNGTDYQFPFSTLLSFVEANLQVGAKITFGTVIPQNTTGNNGDVFFKTDTRTFYQKISGTWSVTYTTTDNSAADGTLLYGTGIPSSSTGADNDSYIDTSTGIFYLRTSGAWVQVFSMATGPQGPQGIPGTNGTNGTNGNTVLNGTTNPANTLGNNGDFYINTSNYYLFGPKAAGIWPAGASIVGAAGADGTDGTNGTNGANGTNGNTILNGASAPDNSIGNNGDFYLNTSNYYLYGPKVSGAWPAGISIVGANGENGNNGTNGTNGTNGVGVPAGGTAGQVLTKIDGTDYNTGWESVSGGGYTPAVWNRLGVAIEAEYVTDEEVTGEPTVLYDTNPRIFTGTQDGNIFKCWFTVGWTDPNICYAESLDGITWTRHPGFVATGHCRSSVLKVGSTYYMYAANSTEGNQIDRLTSTDGINWTLANIGIILKGSDTWNTNGVQNSSVIYDGGSWKMLLEGYNASNIGSIGYYTSTDGITWTEYGSNPVINIGGRFWGGPDIYKVGSTYFVWVHASHTVNTGLPTDLYRLSSSDMVTWTLSPTAPILERLMSDEGVNNTDGQLGDPALVEANGKTYLYYAGVINGTAQTLYHIKVAVANMTMEELVETNEGDNGILEPSVPNSYTKVQSDAKYIQSGTTPQPGPLYLTSAFDGVRVLNPTTLTSLSALLNNALYFNQAGVTNFLSATANGWTFSSWGSQGFSFVNGNPAISGGYGIANLGNVDATGQWTLPKLNLGANPGTDETSGQSSIMMVYNGQLCTLPAKQFKRTVFTNSSVTILSNSTAETTLFQSGSPVNLYGQTTPLVGKQYMYKAAGVYSTPATPGTITIRVKYCGITIASTVITGFAASASNLRWAIELTIATFTVNAAAGTASVNGEISYLMGDNEAKFSNQLNNAGATITNIPNGAYPNNLDVTAQWDTASTSKIFTCTQISIETNN